MRIPIFVIGVARTGTTLAARIAASSSKASSAIVDSLEMLYKTWRFEVAKKCGFSLNLTSPFCDAYFSKERLHLSAEIQDSDISEIRIDQYAEIIAHLAHERSSSYSPVLLDLSYFSNKKNIKDVFSDIINRNTSHDMPYCIFKDNYVIEYALPLKRAFPMAKFIFPVRDPRALIASRIQGAKKNNASAKIHYLSRLRAWRSHIAFATDFVEKFPHDSIILSYEDLVSSPNITIRNLSDILELPQESFSMQKNKFFVSGKPWTSNSSFDIISENIFTISLDKWRSVLSNDIISKIEWLCIHEMKLLNYKLDSIDILEISKEKIGNLFADDYCIDDQRVWISTLHDLKKEIMDEQRRHECVLYNTIPSEGINYFFLTYAIAKKILNLPS